MHKTIDVGDFIEGGSEKDFFNRLQREHKKALAKEEEDILMASMNRKQKRAYLSKKRQGKL
jgi:hypothetical protein